MLIAWILTLVGSFAHAGIPLSNLDSQEFKKVVGDFSGNLVHTSVSGATSLGPLFGVELGGVFGRTNVPNLAKLTRETDPHANLTNVPHFELLAVVTIPMAITLEASLLPRIGVSYFKYNSYAFAAKWTPTEYIEGSPVHFAVKGHIARANMEFDADIANTPTRYDYTGTVSGVTAFLSGDVNLLEPYIGIGFVDGQGKMNVSGATSVFDPPTNSRATRVSSPIYILGVESKLGVIRAGMELSQQFDTTSFTGKFAFFP